MTNPEPQFDIASHYDVMEQLDRDIHDNQKLSASEAALAIKLSRRYLGRMPESVFLPCFGTGRHIPFLLKAGVKQIVGIDLSPACVAKAREQLGPDHRVTLLEGDLLGLDTKSLGCSFDATILLGNSFGDCTDRGKLLKLTTAMMAPLKPLSVLIMDYIGESYLERCQNRTISEWEATLYGKSVKDRRRPRYDWKNQVMSIDIEVVDKADPNMVIWTGSYQKSVLSPEDLKTHFRCAGLYLERLQKASKLNRYVRRNQNQLGMIGQSDWWVGMTGQLFRHHAQINEWVARSFTPWGLTY